MLFHIVKTFEEFVRELIRKRAWVGMQAVIQRGVTAGRPRGLTDKETAKTIKKWKKEKPQEANFRSEIQCI